MVRCALLALVLIPAPAARAEPPPRRVQLPEGRASVEVPTRTGADRLAVPVRINGQDAGWFEVDTCTGLTTVDKRVAEQFKLKVRRPSKATTRPADKQTDAQAESDVADVDEIAFGPATARRQLVQVRDLTGLMGMNGYRSAGILGSDVLGAQPYTLDFLRPSITLYDPSSFTPPADAGPAHRLELLNDSFHPATPGSVDGVPGWFLLDTGNAYEPLLMAPFLRMHHFQRRGPQTEGTTLSHRVQMELVRLDSMQVLGHEFKPALAHLARGTTVRDDVDALYAGVIGVPSFREARLTFDYAGRRVWAVWASPKLDELLAWLDDAAANDLAGETALMKAAKLGRADAVDALLARGADVNARTRMDVTALMLASEIGDVAVVRRLLAAKADPSRPSVYRAATALHRAAERGHANVVAALLEAGARTEDRTTWGETALHRAAAGGYTDCQKALLAHGADVDARTNARITPLMMVARFGVDAMAPLLAAKADVKAVSRYGGVLHYAASAPGVEVVKVLADAGADLDAVDNEGLTPLIRAASMSRADVALELLARGADPTRRAKDGNTVGDYAAATHLLRLLDALGPAEPDAAPSAASGGPRP